MPFESASRPADLNANWPLDNDIVFVGASHLRLIKKMLKGNLLGNFASKQAVKDYYPQAVSSGWVPQNGCLLRTEDRWYQLEFISQAANNIDNDDCFPVTTGVRAVAITRPKILGLLTPQGSLGLSAISSIQKRRPLVRFVNAVGEVAFSVALANSAFPENTPVGNDVCIQLFPTTGQSQIRVFQGSSWTPVDSVVNRTLVSYGLIAAQLVSAISVDSDRNRTMRQEVVGTVNVRVTDPDGFGPDALIVWFGNKALVTGSNGEVNYSTMTIANAISYETLDGRRGFGGQAPTPDPDIPSDATVLPNLGGLGTSYTASSNMLWDSSSDAAVTLIIKSDGTFALAGYSNLVGEPLSGPLLSTVSAGIGSQFEVRFTPIGAVNSNLTGVFNQWLNLVVDRNVRIAFFTSPSANTGTATQQVHVEVRKLGEAAQGKTVSLTASANNYGGAIP